MFILLYLAITKELLTTESTKLANLYDVVCVEDIDLQDQAQSLKLGKSTNDNGFGMFREFLNYKAIKKGKIKYFFSHITSVKIINLLCNKHNKIG